MPESVARYNEMIARLRERDFRLTPQRMALLRLIAASEGHPSAMQLYNQIKTQFPSMSQATVYKTLIILKEMGQVLEIDLRDDSRYDGNKPYPHPHLICNRCGQIIDGDAVSFLHTFNQEISEKYGFQVAQSQMVFYGVCRECQKII